MKTKKMSLANIQGKLSRNEMKNIMAGSDADCGGSSTCVPGQPCYGGTCKAINYDPAIYCCVA